MKDSVDQRGDYIDRAEDMDDDDVDEEGTQRLKSQVVKRKGRGFGVESSKELKEGAFDSLITEDNIEVQKSIEGWILFVTGVHAEATEDDVRDKFADFGTVKNIHLNMDRRTGFAKGYALVEYDNFSSGGDAIRGVNGTDLLGQTIHVSWTFVRNVGGSKGNSYRKRRSASPSRS